MKHTDVEPTISALNNFVEKIKILKTYYMWLEKNKSFTIDLLKQNEARFNKEISGKFFQEVNSYIKDLIKTLDVASGVLEVLEKDKESLSVQYINFLNNEVVNFNWTQFSYLEKHFLEILYDFEKNVKEEKHFTNNDYVAMDLLRFMIESSVQFKNLFIQKLSSINVFNRIGHIDTNIVMVGPNGSGKSTFARNLKGKLGNDFSIISAQHLLIYNSPNNVNPNESSIKNVRSFQKYNKLGSDIDLAHLITNDFSNLVLALFEEKAERESKYYSGEEQRKESIFDTTIGIWEDLITHRKIVQSKRFDINVKTLDGDFYEFNSLSDGEKAIFYYIGHVLLAEADSYIIVDEPENHLHLSICIKLWNTLEQKRSDCKFIYITHNLDFAVSRNNTTMLWNKDFNPPFEWDVEEVTSDETIPDVLLLEIMGSRRNVVFCEGDNRNSLDYKIYSMLFPNYNVIPVNGHDNVISYCKSFNRNRNLGMLEAFGIVDGDAWDINERKGMLENNIMVLPFNEIENLLCHPSLIELVIQQVGSDSNSHSIFIEEFFKIVESEKEKFSTWYANNRINNYLKHNLFKQSKDIEKLKEEVGGIVVVDKIHEFYMEMYSKIEVDLDSKNYDNLIKYVNFKKRLTRELANKYIVDNYEERIINLISTNSEFKNFIKVEFLQNYFSLLTE